MVGNNLLLIILKMYENALFKWLTVLYYSFFYSLNQIKDQFYFPQRILSYEVIIFLGQITFLLCQCISQYTGSTAIT